MRSAGGDASPVDPDIPPDPAAAVAPLPAGPGEDAGTTGPGGVSPAGVWLDCSAAMTRATSAGQNEPSVACVSGPRALIMPITCAGPGRWAGSFFRHASTTWRSLGGIALRSGSVETIRYRTDAGLSAWNGGVPVAAYASTQPREKMSLSGPAGPVFACSGDM